MANATRTDFLWTASGGAPTIVANAWVRAHSNALGTDYFSAAATDPNTGQFSITAPPGWYSLFSGSNPNVGGTPTLRSGNWEIPLTAGDDAALNSATVNSGPYVPSAAVGEIVGVVRDKGGEVYNVKHPTYGAKGDGSTDDTAAIQAAINAANAAGGGIVFFPQGVFIVSGVTTLIITTVQNVTFKGTGWGSSLQVSNSGAGTQFIFQTGTSTITDLLIEDLDLNILYTGGSWAHFTIGSGTAASVRFNRVQFRGVNYTGAIPYFINASATAARGFTDWHITKCRFFNPGTATFNGCIIRGFDGLEVDGCEFVNVNNPLVPDATLQKYACRFTNNYDKYTVSNAGVVNMEGFDIMGCEGGICCNNQQWSTVAQGGTSDIGGMLIDTHAGLITDGWTIVGNSCYGNPIQIAPQNGAPLTNIVISNNTIWGTRSTGGQINSCIDLGGPDAGTSSGIVVTGNTCAGTFTGAPIQISTGYASNAITCQNNQGANPDIIQTPTEAILVSGVTLGLGCYIKPAALTAARVVGAILNPLIGTRVVFTFVQDGTGGRAVTWNAVYKVSWADTGNTLNKRSSIAFIYDGTNWNQDGAQAPYV